MSNPRVSVRHARTSRAAPQQDNCNSPPSPANKYFPLVGTVLLAGTDDAGTDDGVEDAAETGADDTDSATGSRPWSSVSAGITAAAGAAVILAGWGL